MGWALCQVCGDRCRLLKRPIEFFVDRERVALFPFRTPIDILNRHSYTYLPKVRCTAPSMAMKFTMIFSSGLDLGVSYKSVSTAPYLAANLPQMSSVGLMLCF
jgi:hypothetical protein